jgi:hypothetical protein
MTVEQKQDRREAINKRTLIMRETVICVRTTTLELQVKWENKASHETLRTPTTGLKDSVLQCPR